MTTTQIWVSSHMTCIGLIFHRMIKYIATWCANRRKHLISPWDTNMYLKAVCSEISAPRLRGGPRPDHCTSFVQQRLGAGTRWYPPSPTSCLLGSYEASRTGEELLHQHSCLCQASIQPEKTCNSMIHRYDFVSSGDALTFTLPTFCNIFTVCLVSFWILLKVKYEVSCAISE